MKINVNYLKHIYMNEYILNTKINELWIILEMCGELTNSETAV